MQLGSTRELQRANLLGEKKKYTGFFFGVGWPLILSRVSDSESALQYDPQLPKVQLSCSASVISPSLFFLIIYSVFTASMKEKNQDADKWELISVSFS